MLYDNSETIGGVSIHTLAQTYGTPLYIYDRSKLVQQYQQLFDAIQYENKRIYYACKSNSNLSIMKTLSQLGAYLDTVSPEEVLLGIKAGFRPEKILFTGNNNTDQELQICKERQVLVNCGSISQIHRYGKLAGGSDIIIRINPDMGAGHHDHVITGGPKSKFGIYVDQLNGVPEAAKEHQLKIVGIHFHIGSGIRNTDIFLKAMDVLLEAAHQFPNLQLIDFGGGLGVPYRPDETPLDLTEFGQKISQKFESFCQKYGSRPALGIEPGRFISAECGILLVRVNNIQTTPAHKFIGTDSGFNHLGRPMMYGSYHHIVNYSNLNGETEPIVVVGNICESGDVFTQGENGIEDRNIAKVSEGDLLGILCAGAYGFAMASNYNFKPRPAEVFVEDGKHWLIRRRETFNDLVQTMEKLPK